MSMLLTRRGFVAAAGAAALARAAARPSPSTAERIPSAPPEAVLAVHGGAVTWFPGAAERLAPLLAGARRIETHTVPGRAASGAVVFALAVHEGRLLGFGLRGGRLELVSQPLARQPAACGIVAVEPRAALTPAAAQQATVVTDGRGHTLLLQVWRDPGGTEYLLARRGHAA